MQAKPDTQLLSDYAQYQTEAAFTELVTRHTNLVYSAALRMMNSPDLAAEITQNVFIGLARGARTLTPRLEPNASLAGWLCRSARNLACNLRRDEFRQHSRERQAMENQDFAPEPAMEWQQLRPLLDDAMAELTEADYDALVLRYYNNQNLRSVGLALGVSDDTAQKRVSRALEKLRECLSRRGIRSPAAALSLVLSANAVQPAPIGLAAAIAGAALPAAAILATTATTTLIKTIAMTTLQKTLMTLTVTVLVGATVFEARQASVLRDNVATLRQEEAPLKTQVSALQIEKDDLAAKLANVKETQALSKAQWKELLRLRGQSGVSRANSQELAKLKSQMSQSNLASSAFLTNAMATGLKTAENWKLKDAKQRLARMTKALDLSDDQAQAIGDILETNIKKGTQMTLDILSGKSDESLNMAAMQAKQEAEIHAILTPSQLSAYPQYQEAEKTNLATTSANSEATRLAGDFDLSKDQQQQIQASFYQLNLAAADNTTAQQATAGAKTVEDFMNASFDLQKSQLQQKLDALSGILTPAQIKSYGDEQMSQIDNTASAMKMFAPQKAADSN